MDVKLNKSECLEDIKKGEKAFLVFVEENLCKIGSMRKALRVKLSYHYCQAERAYPVISMVKFSIYIYI